MSDASRDDATLAPDHLRPQLEAERDHLRGQLGELAGASYDDNFADSGQVAAEQGEYRALAAQLREQLDDVERALTRVDDGTYGRCEVCDEQISEARLEVMPATRHCIAHAAG
jgi:DnaK suppressor protein